MSKTAANKKDKKKKKGSTVDPSVVNYQHFYDHTLKNNEAEFIVSDGIVDHLIDCVFEELHVQETLKKMP